MSDVLIKGMEMPEGCYYCPVLIGKANCTCAITGTKIRIEKVREEMEDERLPDCPLVELPEHGRLGDLDKMRSDFEVVSKDYPEVWKLVSGIIDRTPTVVEATE